VLTPTSVTTVTTAVTANSGALATVIGAAGGVTQYVTNVLTPRLVPLVSPVSLRDPYMSQDGSSPLSDRAERPRLHVPGQLDAKLV
jgi:hypothetical protein